MSEPKRVVALIDAHFRVSGCVSGCYTDELALAVAHHSVAHHRFCGMHSTSSKARGSVVTIVAKRLFAAPRQAASGRRPMVERQAPAGIGAGRAARTCDL